MTPTTTHLKILSGINERIEGCERDGITGELVIRIPFKQGKVGRVRVERGDYLIDPQKMLDKLEIWRLSD